MHKRLRQRYRGPVVHRGRRLLHHHLFLWARRCFYLQQWPWRWNHMPLWHPNQCSWMPRRGGRSLGTLGGCACSPRAHPLTSRILHPLAGPAANATNLSLESPETLQSIFQDHDTRLSGVESCAGTYLLRDACGIVLRSECPWGALSDRLYPRDISPSPPFTFARALSPLSK